MKVKALSVEDAIRIGRSLPYALIRSLSSVTLGETPAQIDAGELVEARLFSETEEIRLFQQNGVLTAVSLCQEPGDNYWEKTYRVENPEFGKQVTLRHTLDVDEDGQTYISVTRFAGWKGEHQRG